MITALAALGKTNKITLALEYDSTGNVSVVVVLAPKGDAKDFGKLKTFTVDGTVEEVDAGIADEIKLAQDKLTTHASGLAALDEQLAAEKAEKQKELDASKSKSKKPEPKKPEPVKKGGGKATPSPKTAPLNTDKQPDPPAPANPEAPALVPDWKKTDEAKTEEKPVTEEVQNPPALNSADSAAELAALFG